MRAHQLQGWFYEDKLVGILGPAYLTVLRDVVCPIKEATGERYGVKDPNVCKVCDAVRKKWQKLKQA